MITSINVIGMSYEVDDATRKYVIKRIGRLDRYLPRHARGTASATVRLAEVNNERGNRYEAEVTMELPGKSLNAKDATVNMFAAVDIVEEKIKNQLIDYKQSTIAHIGKRRLMSRFKQSFQREL